MAVPTISVVICTFRRPRSLARALHSVAAASSRTTLPWHLVIVDNADDPQTREVAQQRFPRLPHRYVVEPVPGLARARNRALEFAEGEWVVFIDDDVVVCDAWLEVISRTITRYPDMDYFGGRIVPAWADAPPAWLRQPPLSLISGAIGSYDLGDRDLWYDASHDPPWGANFGVRRRLFETVGTFREDLGVREGIPGTGEETELLTSLRRHGCRGRYLAGARVDHFVSNSKLTVRALYRRGIAKGRTDQVLGNPGLSLLRSAALETLYVLKALHQFMRGHGDRGRQCIINAGIAWGRRRKGW